VFELDVVAFAQKLHEPEKTCEHFLLQQLLIDLILLLLKVPETFESMERVLEIIVAIDRLHNKLRVRWYDCGCYLCDFGRYFAS
jgi:low temperature requirement protein LtrA